MNLFLLVYFVAFVAVAFALRSYRVYRETGINPVRLRQDDAAHAYISGVFVVVMAVLAGALVSQAVSSAPPWLMPLPWSHPSLPVIGAGLMLVAFAIVAIAQLQMGRSWRIGIDTEHETELVTRGLFTRSRNPIFLAMQVALLGFLLCAPTMVMLLIVVIGHLVLQIQVRLEEDHLRRQHGEAYEAYCRRVRRWL